MANKLRKADDLEGHRKAGSPFLAIEYINRYISSLVTSQRDTYIYARMWNQEVATLGL